MSDTTSYLRESKDGHSAFLVGKAKGGSQRAWNLLYDKYRTMLVAQVRARMPDFARQRFDAEDILQAAFFRAWENIQSFHYRDEGGFRRWLTTLVLNAFQDELRNHEADRRDWKAERSISELDGLSAPEDAQALEHQAMLEVLGRLDEEDRDILIQRHFEGHSFDTIAAVLGCTRGIAQVRYAEALDRLRPYLREDAGPAG